MTPQELRKRRLQAGMTQAELAVVMGVSANAVSHWEHGIRRFDRREAELLRVLASHNTAEWDSGGILILSWH